jgi:hypothetical protein
MAAGPPSPEARAAMTGEPNLGWRYSQHVENDLSKPAFEP